MAILHLSLDNVLSFNDFDIDFSYPKKLKRSLIVNENIEEIPSFRYKKLNIFVGTNASGKTSFIKCIWTILLFLHRKEREIIDRIINDKDRPSSILLDYVEKDSDDIFRLKRVIIKSINKELLMSFSNIELKDGDSYESKVNELNNIDSKLMNYIDCLNSFEVYTGWNVNLPSIEVGFDEVDLIKTSNEDEESDYIQILNHVMMTLDSSIKNVSRSKDTDDAIVIDHKNIGKRVIQKGRKIQDIEYLSIGTKYGISLANVLFSIKYRRNGLYFIDELFSYVNSDIESSILSTMVSMLGPNEQIFFTTHNENILPLGFPFHSYYFMKKEENDELTKISVVCAAEVENRNNVSVKSILDNDLLGVAPNVNKIFQIGDIKSN